MKPERWTFNREKLLSLRQLKGLSPEQFGQRIGKSGVSVRNWEQGRTSLTVRDLLSIANEFGVHPGSFLQSGVNDSHTARTA